MGATYKTPRTFCAGQSVFIATPSYESVKAGYAYSLAMTTAELTRRGIPFEIAIMDGNCHVDDGRNSLVRDFLEGNCTDMLFIDADLMWSATDVIKILSHKDELVCGAYPFKSNRLSYPIGRIFHTRSDGLMEVSYAPTGFMRIQRSVFEKLWSKQSRHGSDRPTAVFFERRFNGKTRDGGDVTFCRKWIAEGGKVVVDPTFIFSHIGENRWAGRFIDYLSKDENRAKHFAECKDPLIDKPVTHHSAHDTRTVPYWIEKIMMGDASIETFTALVDAYGNKPWAATVEFQFAMYKMAIDLPDDSLILECGSGLSTIVLSATGHQVVAIEESAQWAERTQALLDACKIDARILVSAIDGDWHKIKSAVKNLGADFLVIDGPKRKEGIDRLWPLNNGALRPGGKVIMDDFKNVAGLVNVVAFNGNSDGSHPFVAGRLPEA